MTHRDIVTERIIGAAIAVHSELGPGLLESAYQQCLAAELEALGIPHRREVWLPLRYRTVRIEQAYRMDLVVDQAVVVECKAVRKLEPIHSAQLHTYLRLSGIRTGLMFNFHTVRLKDGGILRYVLG